jgi:predicted RNA polymerase sigma factor
VRDVGLAEELAQDALVAALEQWPESGVPDNPAAWLMATAKHRAIDAIRRGATLERKQEELARELEVEQRSGGPDIDAAIGDYVGDDLLRLMFLTCHPVLSKEARTALTLRLLGGLTTDEIARAFLVAESTVPSGSCAPSAPSPPRACRSSSRPARSSTRGSARCSR